MKTLFAFYLVFFRGYSVMRLCFEEGGCYGACDSELGFDYTHNGNWGKGETPVGAVINCWKNSRTNRITLLHNGKRNAQSALLQVVMRYLT